MWKVDNRVFQLNAENEITFLSEILGGLFALLVVYQTLWS